MKKPRQLKVKLSPAALQELLQDLSNYHGPFEDVPEEPDDWDIVEENIAKQFNEKT